MSQILKDEWVDQQLRFLSCVMDQMAIVDSDLKEEISKKKAKHTTVKKSLLGKIVGIFLTAKTLPEETENKQELKYYTEIENVVFGDGRTIYEKEKDEWEKRCKNNIINGISITNLYLNLSQAISDPVKASRLAGLFDPCLFERANEEAIKIITNSASNYFEFEVVVSSLIRYVENHVDKDIFHKINETMALTYLDGVFASAGGVLYPIIQGTKCSHAGLLPANFAFDDKIPTWTTTDLSKELYYGRTAVEEHLKRPKPNCTPMIVTGVINKYLLCADMAKTSFSGFLSTHSIDHDELKPWILYWATERGYDALSGTNLVDDELVIIKPLQDVNWTLRANLPHTLAAFDAKYGCPPSFHNVPKLPPAPTPAPTISQSPVP